MNTNYRTIYFNYEEADKRLEFWTIDCTLLPKEIAERMTVTCKPKFMVYSEGELRGDIDGADFTKIETLVATYIPGLDEW